MKTDRKKRSRANTDKPLPSLIGRTGIVKYPDGHIVEVLTPEETAKQYGDSSLIIVGNTKK